MPTKKDGKNKCSVCGNENDGKNIYCGICRNELNPQNEDAEFEEQKDLVSPKGQLEDDDTFESEIAEQDTEIANSGAAASSDEEIRSSESDQILDEIEDGQIIAEVRQIKLAWVWSSLIWLIVISAIALYIPEITGIIGIMMAVVVVVPRFFLWKRSSYILTENVLIYNRGGMIRTGTYRIPLSKITEVSENYGRFGRTLGYKSVVIKLANGVSASLAYISPESDLHEQIASLIENNPVDIDVDDHSDRELDAEEGE